LAPLGNRFQCPVRKTSKNNPELYTVQGSQVIFFILFPDELPMNWPVSISFIVFLAAEIVAVSERSKTLRSLSLPAPAPTAPAPAKQSLGPAEGAPAKQSAAQPAIHGEFMVIQ